MGKAWGKRAEAEASQGLARNSRQRRSPLANSVGAMIALPPLPFCCGSALHWQKTRRSLESVAMPQRDYCRRKIAIGLALGFWLTWLPALAGTVDSPFLGQLAVGQNADGRLELFRTDAEGALLHRWQKVPNGEWSPWSNLGGKLAPGLAVAANAEGRLEVFGVDRTRRTLRSIAQAGSNNRVWGAWLDLGGNLRAPVTAGQSQDGRLEVFAVDAGQRRRRMHLADQSPGRLVSLDRPGRHGGTGPGGRAKPRWATGAVRC